VDGKFWRHFSRERISGAELTHLRNRRLQQFVLHAARTVPHYERVFSEMQLKPEAIRDIDDLKQLPIVTAEDVYSRPDDFMSRIVGSKQYVPEPRHLRSSIGDSLPMSREGAAEAMAVLWRFRRDHGILPGTWCAYFGGENVVPQEQTKPPYWRINWPGRQVIFSPYHLSEQTVEAYADALNHYQCPWLHGLPAVIGDLAGLMSEATLSVEFPLLWITTQADRLLAIHRRAIRRAFGIIPKQFYAAPHAVATIAEAEDGRLVVAEDHSAVEFIETNEPSVCRVVGTNFSNLAAPLIRFDTGDLVTLPSLAKKTTIPRVVLACEGVYRDLLVLPSGVRIGRLERMFDDVPAVLTAQIMQNADRTIDIDVVATPGLTAEDDRAIRDRVAARLGDARWRIAFQDKLPDGASGKIHVILSEADQTNRAVVQPRSDWVVIE
jgi:phenylacetate-CoA ligase